MYSRTVLLCVGLTSTLVRSLPTSNNPTLPNVQAAAYLPPVTCSSSSNITVQCHSGLQEIAFNGRFPNEQTLEAICTDTCRESLQSTQNAQRQACLPSKAVSPRDATSASIFEVDYLLFTYAYSCLRDRKTRKFCLPLLDDWDTAEQSKWECSECRLETLRIQYSSPLGFGAATEDILSSVQSSCNITANDFKRPITNLNVTNYNRPTLSDAAAPSLAPKIALKQVAKLDCEKTIAVQPDQDCNAVSQSASVSTFSLLYKNGLEAYCGNFPAQGDLCIPQSCAIYQVKSGDTCPGIVQTGGNSFNETELLSWNVNINRDCSNLGQLENSWICVGPPGGQGIPKATSTSPIATIEATATSIMPSTTDSRSLITNGATVSPWAFPTMPVEGRPSTQALATLPIASGTPLTCIRYESYLEGSDASANTCHYLAWFHGIEISDFVALNPSLVYNEGDPSACVLSKSLRYCVMLGSGNSTIIASSSRPSIAHSLPLLGTAVASIKAS